MSDPLKDLMDICQINILEESLERSPAPDRDNQLMVLDYYRRNLTTKLMGPNEVAPEVIERHVRQNTINGVYPWIDAPSIKKGGEE